MTKLIWGFGALILLSSCSNMDHETNHPMSSTSSTPLIIEGDFSTELTLPKTLPITNATLEAQAVMEGLGYYSGGTLGPTLEGQTGDEVHLKLHNQLSESTNLHWHGLMVPADQDGHPTQQIAAGASKEYSFTLKNRAGMYWYHPHLMGSTAKQAFQGLAGLIILRDSEEQALRLPSGEYELPLVIQDRRSAGTNYNPSMNETMTGFMGEKIFVNGIASPFVKVKKGVYRLRLLNGSNARVYQFAISDSRSFTLIGSDGGLLGSPQAVSNLLLGPGERADILVDFSSDKVDSEPYLISQAFHSGIQGNQSFKILKFKVLAENGISYSIPTTLTQIHSLNPTGNPRLFKLEMMDMSSMNHSMGGMHTINGKVYDSNRVDLQVKALSTEVWEFENLTDEIHPIHLHGVQFQVLSRGSGRPLQALEKGWKDTFVLLPNEKASIQVPFGAELGKFLFHCHNLEHEEDGMMAQYEVIP